jgi:hypothetical protein
MGILDEAIRDHLELKRQHGAQSDELKRLEDEAFGPPARPGEPEFGGDAATGAAETGVAVVDEPVTREDPSLEDAREEPPAGESPVEATGISQAPERAESPEPGGPDRAEPPATEHAVVSNGSEAETTLYDHALEDELDLEDVDASVEEEGAAARPQGSEPPAPPADPEPPIESLPTVEHPFEPESEELRLEPPSEELEAEDAGEGYDEEDGEEGSARADSSEEDVLADTPEFLRDAPEDDELWFEQGEPKDFDFD